MRAVGGLIDSVRPFNPRTGHGTGFLFADYHPRVVRSAARCAGRVCANKKIWTRLQKNGMRVDFSWDRSAGEYVKMCRAVEAAEGTENTRASEGSVDTNRSGRAASN